MARAYFLPQAERAAAETTAPPAPSPRSPPPRSASTVWATQETYWPWFFRGRR